MNLPGAGEGDAGGPKATGIATRAVEAVGISVHFSGLVALSEVDLSVAPGEILGLIGPNGAGKTTLVNVLSGFQPAQAGAVILEGKEVTRWSPDRRARAGLARTFQNIRPFRVLTAAENVEAGALAAGMSRVDTRETVGRLLALLHLTHVADWPAGVLSHGDERRLGIARALAAAPRVLLLDEPAAGLNEYEGDRLLETLWSVRDQLGCALLVIEHDMRLVMRLCERLQVLDYGKTIAIGTPEEVQKDPAVIAAYLGSGHGVNGGSS